MASGRSTQITKQVGEYLVACELARRNLLVATFSGNVPDYDLIATDSHGNSCPIQVKTIRKGTWQFSIKNFIDVSMDGDIQNLGRIKPMNIPELICVFVIASRSYGKDQFFVLKWGEARKIIIKEYKHWLDSHGGKRPRNPYSFHCSLTPDRIMKYKNNWNLITRRFQMQTVT